MARVQFNMKAALAPLDKAQKALVAIGLQLERDIKVSMTTGTGRTYRRGNIVHVASAPGQPPAVDTGRLRASISTNWSDSGLSRGRVGGQADSENGIGQPNQVQRKFTVVVGTNVLYACLSAGTTVLTKEGGKRISSVKKGDLVLTQTGEYHKVLNTIKIKNTDRPDMVTIDVAWRKGMSRKLTMTKEHKVLVYREGRNKWVCAGDLLESDRVYSKPKIACNKGTGKYNDIICRNCGDLFQGSKGKKIYCSVKCRALYWKENDCNPHSGVVRLGITKQKMREKMRVRLLERPETHANHIMGKKGFQTNAEKQVYEWLMSRRLKRRLVKQYPVAGKFVDFYIPSLNHIYEADGAFWHQDQMKDINRDKKILEKMPDVKITHIHFFDEKHSPKDLFSNPLPNVYYSVCNPGPDSFVDLSIFSMYQIRSIKHWKYIGPQKGDRRHSPYLYDLCVDTVHSYYANNVLVSNSWLEFGTRRMAARPFIRPAFDKIKSRIASMLAKGTT